MNGRLRSLTIDEFADPPSRSVTPEFREVVDGSREKHPEQFELLCRVALRLGAERGRPHVVVREVVDEDGEVVKDTVIEGGFTAEDVLEAAGGRQLFPKNLIGAVLGSLRSGHAICTSPEFRVKSKHRSAKGRWQNTFMLNPESIVVREP
jgi:hypothetical protein